MSKKAQRKMDREKRQTWGGVRPVTKVKESKKAYHRKKAWKGYDDSHSAPFYFRDAREVNRFTTSQLKLRGSSLLAVSQSLRMVWP